jgi:hypothetical protein
MYWWSFAMADYYIYAYIDPRNGEAFYIGAGHGKRAWRHLTECKYEQHPSYNNFFYKKLRKLLKSGGNPVIKFVAENLTQGEAFKIWEPFFICALGRRDLKTGRLCNHTDGGEGGNNLSPETRARMSASAYVSNKKRYEDPEARARMSAAMKKCCADPEVRARKSAAAKKHYADPEARARMSASQRNKPPQKGRKFKGVFRRDKRYMARIGGKYLGTCDTAEEAAKLYNDAVDLYWGGDGWKNPV